MDSKNWGLINYYNTQSNLNRSTSQTLSATKTAVEQKIQKLQSAKMKLSTQITNIENIEHNDFSRFSRSTDGFKGTVRNKFNGKCSNAKNALAAYKKSHTSHKTSIESKIKKLQREVEDLSRQISAANSLANYYDNLSRQLL